jgi:hypothetical protein
MRGVCRVGGLLPLDLKAVIELRKRILPHFTPQIGLRIE